jgi:hypothetical protein
MVVPVVSRGLRVLELVLVTAAAEMATTTMWIL